MRGSRRGAGRAPAEPEPKRLPGWTLGFSGTSWVPGAAAAAATSGGWCLAPGSGAPPRSGRAAPGAARAGRRESGLAEAARSLTPRGAPGAAAAAAATTAQADNELASARSRGRFGPRDPRPSLPEATEAPSRGRPLAAGSGRALGAPRAGDPAGRVARPPPRLGKMRSELGDGGLGGGVVAPRTAGGRRGAHATGHARGGCPGERPQESESGRRAAGGGPTDRQIGAFSLRARFGWGWGWGWGFPSLALRFPAHFWEVSRRGPRQVGVHLPLFPGLGFRTASSPRLQSCGRTGRGGLVCVGGVPGAEACGTGFREGDRGGGPGRRRGRGEAQGVLNFCSPLPLPSSPPPAPSQRPAAAQEAA